MNNTPNSQRRNSASEIITTGHVWSAVWFLAWPTAVNTIIITAYNIINRIFLGRIPNAENALAAVGIGGAILMIQFAVLIGLSTGTAALVSRFLGAGNMDDAVDATKQSLILSIVVATVSSVPLILFATPLARLIGATSRVAPLAGNYTAIICWFSIPLFLYMIAQSALRSTGDAKSPLYAGAVIITTNALFDYLLIFGVGPIPPMGIYGAAVSTVISRFVGMFVTLWFLKRSVLSDALSHWHIHRGWFGRILRIGWPASMQNLLYTVSQAGFIKVLAALPANQITPAQAAYTVAITIESMAFMPGVAYSTAATPLVGQNIGAGNLQRAVHSAWVATGQAVMIMTSVAMVFLFAPTWLAHIFTYQAAVVPLIVTYLRINALSEPFLAVSMVLRGALQGAGETRVPALITLLTNIILRVPVAYLLAVHADLGATGAWAAMAITTALSGVLTAIWFQWGNWRDIQI